MYQMCRTGPGQVTGVLLMKPATLSQMISSLVECFAVDASGAALLLHAKAAGTGGGVYTHPGQAQTQNGTSGMLESPSDFALPEGSNSAVPGVVGNQERHASTALPSETPAGSSTASPLTGVVVLPRMPLSLLYLGSARSYGAVAIVARSLGRLARLADIAGGKGDMGKLLIASWTERSRTCCAVWCLMMEVQHKTDCLAVLHLCGCKL